MASECAGLEDSKMPSFFLSDKSIELFQHSLPKTKMCTAIFLALVGLFLPTWLIKLVC